MQKIAIIGKGTAGAISAMKAYGHSLNSKRNIVIDWYFDDNIPTQAVGEGTTITIPTALSRNLNFEHHNLHELDGTFKSGITKKDWNIDSDYVHTFKPPLVAYHFNAIKLQNYILDKLKNQKNVTIIDKNISSKEVDADLIIDCSGRPNTYEDFILSPYIAVNSVHVTQCYWDYARFQHTVSDATKYGWVFGVPLQNRCSIGYLYNNKFNSLEEVKEDVKNVFARYNLTPSDTTNSFSFQSYYRKKNYVDNIAYNGNSSFFLEPLEATSTSLMVLNADNAIHALEHNFNSGVMNSINRQFINQLESITTMIMLHYFAGSIYKNDFWDFAQHRAADCLLKHYDSHPQLRALMRYCFRAINDTRSSNPLYLIDKYDTDFNEIDNKIYTSLAKEIGKDYGSWYGASWVYNIVGLRLYDKLKNHLSLDDLGNKV